MKNLSDINIEKSRSGVYKDNSENRRLHRVGQRYGSTGGSDIEDLKKDKKENSEKEGKFSRVNLPDIPNAHKVNLTKYLSEKRKKAVDDAWDKAKFDSLPREKAGVFQEVYNKLREQFNNNFDDMSKSERAELLYKILKVKNAMERGSSVNSVKKPVDERLNVTPMSDPVKYSENARNSVEKKNLVEVLRGVGKPVKEEETETGTYGIYKVGNSYIQVVGSEVTTGLKKETSKKMRLGMSGYKRWYGGGEFFNKTDKSETFSVYDSEKLNSLIEKLKIKNAMEKGSVSPVTSSTKKEAKTSTKSSTKKVPSGIEVEYDDSLVAVYNDKGEKVYQGIYDYSPYRDEDEKWNEREKNYDLPNGYKMVGLKS